MVALQKFKNLKAVFQYYLSSPITHENVEKQLKLMYKTKLKPLEEHYQFHDFHSTRLDDADFDAKPMILLMGQYSTGKTTFIRYLLGNDFPGLRIGPEPTTDKFTVVMNRDERQRDIIPGNALVMDPKLPFKPLSRFGNTFLNRFQGSCLDSPVLRNISIVDTPGVLSGEKQRVDRGYDFAGVTEWFAERVDRIILLFDAHKLDISDEFRRSLEALRGHDDKIRIILNKADMVNHQELMRVYGGLMWSLGKVFNSPEMSQVYIGSFWDRPLRYDINRRLFEDEKNDLFRDLLSLPKNAAMRKVNDLYKRARLAKEILIHKDFSKFQNLNPKMLEAVDKMLSDDIAKLMAVIPAGDEANTEEDKMKGGAFDSVADNSTPFGHGRGEGADAGSGESEWIISREKEKYDKIFNSLGPVDGKVSGSAAKSEMLKSKLPNSALTKIWLLSDIDKDGMLDSDEFALAMHLIGIKLDGHDIPEELPSHLVPPSKRDICDPAFLEPETNFK
ncbi:EH domain-containing protein 3-like isoform X2 [Ischnura elegans]|uniref:EH domain-containing protein 3-like isoform X2 n=1 Tax=Ischnura elegans TaxID=197161 RepID=UPI001ED8BF39|nr:EH domain-containing protein 3-like isoform X2 [Ischnura elegans]